VSDVTRSIAKYEKIGEVKKPAYAFSGEKASAGDVGVVRLSTTLHHFTISCQIL